jgi:hypothetical protein
MKTMKTLSRMMLAAAATSLAVLPVAAEAGTRASSTPAVSAPGKGRAAKGEKAEASLGTVVIVGGVAFVAVAGGLWASSKSGNSCRSPGAC